MKKTCFLISLLAVLMAWVPRTAVADDAVTLADWQFEQSDDVAATWFGTGGAPAIAPDSCVGDASLYNLTAWSEGRYWQLCTGWQGKVLRIENNTANAITDYTDASQHNVYYEISFPTTGYKNICVKYACAYGANAAASIEAVVSTDGGTTWADAGTGTTAASWWTYNENTVSLSAANKEKVIVRLIAGNDYASNWNLDYITVTGEAQEEALTVNESDYTLKWPLGQGTDDATAAEVSIEGVFSVAEFDHGQLTVSTQRSAGTSAQTLYKPSISNGAVNDDDVLTFTIVPKKGITFTPASFSFEASRWGTGGGKFDVVAIANGQETTLATGINPDHGNKGLFSACSYDLSGITVGEDGITLKIKVYSLASNKEYGFGNIIVKGAVSGTVEAVPSYTLSVASNMSGAGKLSSNPAGSEFDEGTSITVSATENFGYHFTGWADADGTVVSESKTYSFEIAANTTLTAVYTATPVYALNLTLEGGANSNLVQWQPEGNIVDGVHYFEEGTDVKLTAQNNKILTFTNWEDNSTDAERMISMTEDKSVTATFSAADYIVAWDLYNDKPNSERAADYKADSENAGLLSLRTEAGTTSSWLTRGVNNGAENGRYGARIWRLLSDEYYFEISFSTKGYSNVSVSNGLCTSYNSYTTINAQYSIDGETYTTFGTFTMGASGWVDNEFSLPEEAWNQDRVYIRWMPDRTSDLVGTSSTYDGLCIGDIFVMGESNEASDETAPQLVSSNPADGATDVSANGSIILTFDEKIKAGEGQATLGNESLSMTVSGKNAIFAYSALDYSQNYTFTLPAGVITDRNGNAFEGTSLTFTTMERQQPDARLYDAIVAQDGSGDFLTVQGAIDAAPEGRATPWLIFIKNGSYNEHVDIPASKPNLHFTGQDRDKTIILDNRLCGGDNAYAVDPGATVVVKGEDCFFENLTMENSYGHEKQAGPQALALNTVADRTILNKVALLSYQDTWITPSTTGHRAYAKHCLIEGAVDFIYNSGDIYLNGDTLQINRPSGGYIVAPRHALDAKWGYVFMNNVIKPAPGIDVTDVWLGRPWHDYPKTVFINTRSYVTIPAKGWYETMGGLPVLWADYNTMDAEGNPVDLSQRQDTYYYKTSDGTMVYGTAKNYLTDEEAAQYTIKNVLSGDDNWQPDIETEPCDAPSVTRNGSSITWEAVPYAICYVVIVDDYVTGFTTETTYNLSSSTNATAASEESVIVVRAVNEYGGLSEDGVATDATAIDEVKVSEIATTEYFTADGVQLAAPQRGLNIVRQTDVRGNVITRKAVY